MFGAGLALGACHQGVKRAPPPSPAPRPDVSYEAVEPAGGARHYSVEQGHQMVGASYRRRVLPVYPARLVARQLPPVSVTATLVTDAQGRVSRVLIPAEAGDPADRKAFDEAVRQALLQWRFSPLRDSVWKTEADGTRRRVELGAGKPFSLTYRFHFKLVDGKPVVTGGRH